MSDPYADFPSLRFERPEAGILRIVLDAPGLNAVGPQMHRDLADVWLAVDRDPETRVAILCGAGTTFISIGYVTKSEYRFTILLSTKSLVKSSNQSSLSMGFKWRVMSVPQPSFSASLMV